MRAALVVAVVLAACGLLVVGSRGEAACGDGREVGSASRACWERAAAVLSRGAGAGLRGGQHAPGTVESWRPAHEGDVAVLASGAAATCGGGSSPPVALCAQAGGDVREAA